MPETPPSRIDGERYIVTPEERAAFRRDGYVHLPGVLRPDELARVEEVVERFITKEIPVPGRDYCDMAGDYDRSHEEYAIVNVMLPRRYHPEWQGNLFERRAASIAEQLQGPGLEVDYDQILDKNPGREDAVFGWHQDMAYWIETPDMRTATLWLAIDDSTEENGCMRFVPGSHAEAALRPHHPLHGDRGESHALVTELDPSRDRVRPVPIARGDVTVHDERVVHGSGGNRSDGRRRAYVLAFRSADTIAEERRRGFTHSHNDGADVLDDTGIRGQSSS